MQNIKAFSNYLAGLLFIFTGIVSAQNEDDALRYANIRLGGTARSSSMGGAFGALGSDFSSLSINPAGLGLYRKSEFTLTPVITGGANKSTYLSSENTDNKFQFVINNAGVVLAGTRDSKKDKWKGFAFGIGYNRINNFGARSIIEGNNKSGSITDGYLMDANGKNPSDLTGETSDAWNTYLIDTLPGNNTHYFSQIPGSLDKIQRKTFERRGGMGETVISFAGNYDNKLFLGGTVGFQKVRYWEDATYAESPSIDTFKINGFTRTDYLNTDGNGVNFKFGAIYMPAPFIRIGAAIHSPTFLRLRDTYSSTLNTSFKDGSSYTVGVDENGVTNMATFDYRINTPYHAVGSLAFILGQYGLISADYEFIDYRESKIRASGYSFTGANNNIRDKYKASSNIRIGGELRLDPFSIRLGYGLYGSAFKNKVLMSDLNCFSGGLGYRQDGLFIDLAYVRTSYTENYYLYSSTLNPNPSINKITRGSVVVTLGFRF